MHTVTRELLASAVFPHAPRDVRVCETHLSFIVLTGELAYKIKKAVSLDFIDTTSLERRHQLCEDELRLNQRYASDLYLRVVPVTFEAGTLHFAGSGEAVEYAVEMREFDSSEELAALVEAGAATEEDLSGLADCVADFHRRALPRRTDDDAATRAYVRKAQENLTAVAARAPAIGGETQVARLRKWTDERLARDLERLRSRECDGFVRECHGDLHSGNVVRWNGALMPFDCIEFDPELRFIDVLSDIAFLAMDLIAKDRVDLAFALLNRYLERNGDYQGVPLLPSYLVYRALVRTKVELIAFEQHPEAVDAAERARTYLSTALSVAHPDMKPALIVMHGASGSGKSWLSAQLVPKLPALRVRSDLERKRLAGIDPFDPSQEPNPDIYTLEFNDRTYEHLRACAHACLRGGMSAIVDAAFLKAHERRTFAALAREQGATFSILSCRADPDTLAARIARRRLARNDPSDADEQVMRRQLATMEPFTQDELPHLIEADTRADDVLSRVLSSLSVR